MNLFAPFLADCYKLGHGPMYSVGTESVLNNNTPRTDRIYRQNCTRYYDGKLVWIGAQGAVHETVENWDKFFAMNKEIAIARFQSLSDFVLGEGVVSSESLAKLHDLGYLPLEIRALEEGTKVPMGIPVTTVRNTHKDHGWLVNFLETTLSSLTWKPATNATIAGEYHAMFTDFAVRTGTPLDLVKWQGHCFADRGMSGPEDAARSGFGHSAYFLGTDSLGTILYAQEYYGATGFVAGSVPATEHAVATSNILRIERELYDGTYEFKSDRQGQIHMAMAKNQEDDRLIAEMMFLYELLLKFPTGILSYVTDSFDFWGVLTKGLPYMKEVIMARNGKLVIRPDSGDPVEVVCGVPVFKLPHTELEILEEGEDAYDSIVDLGYGLNPKNQEEVEVFVRSSDGVLLQLTLNYEYYRWEQESHCEGYSVSEVEEMTPEQKGAVQVLGELFGTTTTSTGHKMLDEHIGLIYGDSITTKRCLAILERLESKGYASGNFVAGIGSYTYQCNTRDTFGFAIKATHTIVNGEEIDIFKDPKTDSKKKSAKGRVKVLKHNGEYVLLDQVTEEEFAADDNQLKVIFKDGRFFNQITLDQIRAKL